MQQPIQQLPAVPQPAIAITFVITGLGQGGAEAMLLKLLQNLDRRRFMPRVVSLTTRGELAASIEDLGIPVTALEARRGWRAGAALPALVRLLRAHRPQIVHTWMYHADLLGGVAARWVGVRQLVWGIRHSNLSPEVNKRSTLAVAAWCARLSHWLPARILACSDAAMASHVRHGYCARKMSVIPNGFDISRFTPDPLARHQVRGELGLAPRTMLVGMVARYDVQKNHAGFLQAMGLVHRRLPEVHFLLAGLGIDPDNQVLLAAAQAAGIATHCHFLGPRSDVPRLMAALDVLVLPSHGEAFPNVLGEAMACEVPCVVTDVGDSAFIVGATGRIVPRSDDTQGLAEATTSMLLLPQKEREALGQAARARVAQYFELQHVVRKYENFYADLAGHTANAPHQGEP